MHHPLSRAHAPFLLVLAGTGITEFSAFTCTTGSQTGMSQIASMQLCASAAGACDHTDVHAHKRHPPFVNTAGKPDCSATTNAAAGVQPQSTGMSALVSVQSSSASMPLLSHNNTFQELPAVSIELLSTSTRDQQGQSRHLGYWGSGAAEWHSKVWSPINAHSRSTSDHCAQSTKWYEP